tara:strand:+ start:671 stop:1300 length:630 start_codon:yes stop_codon:yes gene_type:complete
MNLSELLLISLIWLILLGIAIQQKLKMGIIFLGFVYLFYLTTELFWNSKQITEEILVMSVSGEIIADSIIIELDEIELKNTVETVVDSVNEERVEIVIQSPNLALRQITICKAINNRKPLGSGTEFTSEVDNLFCFTGIRNLVKTDTVTHIWYYQNREMARIPIEVGQSSFWRAWSRKTILPRWVGEWEVIVFDSEGNQLGSKIFQIVS